MCGTYIFPLIDPDNVLGFLKNLGFAEIHDIGHPRMELLLHQMALGCIEQDVCSKVGAICYIRTEHAFFRCTLKQSR